MSLTNFIKQSIGEIESFLAIHQAQLSKTSFPNTYIVKFTQETNVNDPEINHLKGLIFNHSTGTIISMTYPVPSEIKELTPDKLEIVLDTITSSQYRVEEQPDGTLFRYAYNADIEKWILSTNNKEDANVAFWMNGIPLSQLFESIKNPAIDVATFDKNHIHMFVMCHPLNVIVVNHEESKIYHVSTYDRTTLTEINIDLGISKPQIFNLTPRQVNQQTKEAKETPVKSVGYMIIVTNKDNTTHRYRFENHNYTRAKELRGHSNNIEYHLLNMQYEKGQSVVDEFLQFYPIYKGELMTLMNRVDKLSAKLYREYGLRYKNHEDIKVHSRHHKLLGELHQKLYKDVLKPIGKTLKYDDIHKFLVGQPTAKLLYLINYIYEKPKINEINEQPKINLIN